MSSSHTDERIDPLIDAYRQASELEAQNSGARPSAALRAAVLAHARVVAQSVATDEPKLAVSDAVRATPAANESRPIWRIAAGVVLGVVGLWVYQLTRPGSIDEANVAVLSAPQNAKATAAESAVAAAAPVASVAAGASGAVGPARSAAVAAPAQQKTAVAAATSSKAATGPRDTSARERLSATSTSAGVMGPRDGVVDAARSDPSVALAKADAPATRAEQASQAAGPTAVAVTVAPVAAATTSAIPEAGASEPLGETIVASAEMRKATRPSAVARAPAVVAAPPNAFPATGSGAMAAAAPPPAAPAASPQAAAAGGNAAMRQGIASTAEAAMFSAIRIGNVNAFRAAFARGANVNARDEAGRSALQIARERNDADMVKALESAGAK